MRGLILDPPPKVAESQLRQKSMMTTRTTKAAMTILGMTDRTVDMTPTRLLHRRLEVIPYHIQEPVKHPGKVSPGLDCWFRAGRLYLCLHQCLG